MRKIFITWLESQSLKWILTHKKVPLKWAFKTEEDWIMNQVQQIILPAWQLVIAHYVPPTYLWAAEAPLYYSAQLNI